MAKQKTLIEGFWDRANKAMEGKSKKDLARQIGCDRKTLYGNYGTLSPVYLARFCVLTGADANWLLGIKGGQITMQQAMNSRFYDRNGKLVEVPEQPCDDAISRQAVDTLVDELARAISDERCCISRGRSTAAIMQDILDLPPVTPKPKADVLDKIRAEIEDIYCSQYCEHPAAAVRKMALKIIDKYKAESEDKG